MEMEHCTNDHSLLTFDAFVELWTVYISVAQVCAQNFT